MFYIYVDTTKLQQNFIKEVYKAWNKGHIIPKFHYKPDGGDIYITNINGTALYRTSMTSWCISLDRGIDCSQQISKLIPTSFEACEVCKPTGVFKMSEKGQVQEFELDNLKIYIDSKLLATFGKDVVLAIPHGCTKPSDGLYRSQVAVYSKSQCFLGVIMPVRVN